MAGETVHPCPLFEGSEKRIVVEFSLGAATPFNGLRALTRAQLDALMQQVSYCCSVAAVVCILASAYKSSEAGQQALQRGWDLAWVALTIGHKDASVTS